MWARREGGSLHPPRCWRAAQPHGTAVTRHRSRCRARGGRLRLSRARRSLRPGPAEGGSSLRGGAAVLHLGPAGLNLEPSRLFLGRCSSRWHCAGGNLGEVSEGLGRGSLPRIRALHTAAWAASAPKSPQLPPLALPGTCGALHLQMPPWRSPAELSLQTEPSENRGGEKQAGKRESSKV